MQGPDLLYFLLHPDGRSYHVNDMGQVALSASPIPIQYGPDGWQDIAIQWQRNRTYFAIQRMFSAPQSFVEDGAQIIKDLRYKQGILAPLNLLIVEQVMDFDPVANTYGYRYQKLYLGEIDLRTFRHEGPKVTVSIMEGGLHKFIKAYENTPVEIPLFNTDTKIVRMDGSQFTAIANYRVIPGTYQGEILLVHNLPIVFINNEGFGVEVTNESQQMSQAIPGQQTLLTNSGAPFQARIKGSVQMVGRFAATGYDMAIVIRNPDGSRGPDLFFRRIDIRNDVIFTIDFDLVATIPTGCKVQLMGHYQHPVGTATEKLKMEYLETEIEISYNTKYRTTLIHTLPPLFVLQQIIKKLTDGKYTASSDLLNRYQNRVLTSGDGIRGLAGAVLKISLSDFFKLYNMQLCAGMGVVGDVLVFESRQWWASQGDIIDLGEVSKLVVSSDSELPFSTLKIGYPNQEYNQALGDINGRNEFNTTHIYTTPDDKGTNEMDLTTNVRADMTGIERTRINLDGKRTTDSKADNEVFVLAIEMMSDRRQIYNLDRSLNQYATGLLDAASAFNLPITPKNCVMEWGAYIRGCLDKMDHGVLKFQTMDKNPELAVISPTRAVVEKADVPLASLPAKFFTYDVLEIETSAPVNLQAILSVQPLVTFRFSYRGVTLKGITGGEVGVQPTTNGVQNFTLQSTPDNDLTKLIDVYE